MLFCRCVLDRYLLDRWASDSYMSDRKVLKVRHGLTLTKLAGNQPSSSSICPHHQSLFEASNTLMTSPALKASSRSAMVTWSHTASAFTTEPPLTNYREIEGEVQDKLQEDNSYITQETFWINIKQSHAGFHSTVSSLETKLTGVSGYNAASHLGLPCFSNCFGSVLKQKVQMRVASTDTKPLFSVHSQNSREVDRPY